VGTCGPLTCKYKFETRSPEERKPVLGGKYLERTGKKKGSNQKNQVSWHWWEKKKSL
jgi:hypothetical protein